MDALVCLTSTRGTWVCCSELDSDPTEGVRGVNGDIGNHDGSSNSGRGRGLDVQHPGVDPVPPVLPDHYEVNSIATDVTGANDEWTTACRMGACII